MDRKGPRRLHSRLERWIDPAKFGWYSGDHHIHAAGCSSLQNPTEGVDAQGHDPADSGRAPEPGSVLTWGPDYYYQKQFFSGHDRSAFKPDRLMHYDLEVSGFPPATPDISCC